MVVSLPDIVLGMVHVLPSLTFLLRIGALSSVGLVWCGISSVILVLGVALAVVDEGAWAAAVAVLDGADDEAVAGKLGAQARVGCSCTTQTMAEEEQGKDRLWAMARGRRAVLVLDGVAIALGVSVGRPVGG
jgi:hypothetical protein